MSSIASIVHRAHLPLSAMLVATALVASAPTTLAQDGGAAASADAGMQEGLKKAIGDFVHYVLIGKADLAQAAAEAALGMGASDADMAVVVDSNDLGERLSRAVARSRAMGGVSDLATKIENSVENGRRELSRDQARIGEAIGMLGKSLRERMLAADRLDAAGEYAVPQLVKALVETRDPALELEVVKRLESLKRFAVLPLSMSLADLDSVAQRKVVAILGQLGYPTAIPFIVELAANPSTSVEVKAACEVAYQQLGGSTMDVSAQFTALAKRFFDRNDSLVAYPGDAMNNVWSYAQSDGLSGQAVSTAIFCDEMAMAMARRALSADAGNGSALAIYIAADLRRENTLGSDAQPSRYSPEFFATAAGPSVCNEVLGLALDSRDTALIRDAIAALAETAGGQMLVAPGGRAPILEAMRYSDRRVRLDAALVLANNPPMASFAGDHNVIPTLASAVVDSSMNRAAVLGGDSDDRQAIGGQLQAAGFVSVANGESYDALEVDVVKADGVDLVVLRGSLEELKSALARVRAGGLTSASPVLAIANALEDVEVRRAFDGDRSVVIWTEGSTAETFRSAAASVVASMSGSALDDAESAEYAARAADALLRVAQGASKTFDVTDGEPQLLRAFATQQGGLRLMVGQVLAMIASPAGQGALIDAALAASGDEQITLCDLAALASRRSGGKASDAQLSALRDAIGASEGATADALGRLHGSVDAGSAQVIKLITE